jgi:TM2 domain-containing membrane protein YozV
MSQETGNSKLVPMAISFFVWGGGQLYEGRTKAGIAWLVAWAVSMVLSVLTVGLFGFVAFLLWAVNLYDTYTVLIDIDD